MEFRNARNAVICQRRPAKSQNLPTLLVPRRRFDPNQPELIDRPDLDLDSLRHELAALEEANRRLGGHHLILHYLRQMLRRVSLKSITVLDLGTGVADIPRVLVAW